MGYPNPRKTTERLSAFSSSLADPLTCKFVVFLLHCTSTQPGLVSLCFRIYANSSNLAFSSRSISEYPALTLSFFLITHVVNIVEVT